MSRACPTVTHPTEPPALWRKLAVCAAAGNSFAVATVLRVEGSTPVPAGARAMIAADGAIHGTVGGGAVEAAAIDHARQALKTGEPVVFDFDLRGPGTQTPAPICGGLMRLLVDPTAPDTAAEIRRASEALERRARGVWLTTLPRPAERRVAACFVPEEDIGRLAAPLPASALRDCLTRETPLLLEAGEAERREYFLEPLLPRPVLLIVGGGHVGQALAAQASLLGFELAVIEDRLEFANPALFPPGTQTRCGDVAAEVAAFPVHGDTYIVLVTRGHQLDSAALRACIHQPAAYLGMIGSRRKVPLVRQQFLQNGWATAEEFARVHAPIGLDIGAVTVPEIATSILAQIIAVRRRKTAPRIPLD